MISPFWYLLFMKYVCHHDISTRSPSEIGLQLLMPWVFNSGSADVFCAVMWTF
jgi:hypothetical protein